MATAAEKSFQLQMQMRRNTEEMSEFLKDMSEWTNDVKRKDESLKANIDHETALIPPIRSQPKPRKKKKRNNAEDSKDDEAGKDGKKKDSKISGYDYRAWDKFDVDAALKEVDGDGEQPVPLEQDDGSTDEEECSKKEEERRHYYAVYFKEKGNDFFKKGKWEEAVECYTRGLQHDSLNAVLFANRAMALLKLKKYAAALVDCDCSIELDDSYTKAYLRRATAHLKLDLKQEALNDFRKVLEFEPENKLAVSTVTRLEKELEPVEEYKPRQHGDITNMKRTKPSSDKPMRRIHVEEVSLEEYTKFNLGLNKNNIIELIESDEFVKLAASLDKADLDNLTVPPADKTPPKAAPAPPKKVEYQNLPTLAPVNSLQFNTDVRRLKSAPEKLFEYIKKIDPDVYPKLFQQSLEADQLFMFLDILEKFYIPNNLPIYHELYYLTKVNRFSMAIMFKSRQQEQTINTLMKYLLRYSDAGKDAVNNLIKAYGTTL